MRLQTQMFRQGVRARMRPAPFSAGPETPCAELVARMTATGAGSAVIVDAQGRPVGLVTERDVVRRIAFRQAPDTPARAVMSAPVVTVAADDYLYRAIARMRRLGLRHMPVVDAGGRLAGMLDLDDSLAAAAGDWMGQIDRLTPREPSLAGWGAVRGALASLAAEWQADDLPAPEILGLMTRINNDLVHQVIDSALAMMAAQGWGEPPVGFCALVMGSGGRGENFLAPDQDNAFILDDYADGEHARIDGFFIELAARMTGDLDRLGLPFCGGYCMAINPLWRKTLGQWRRQLQGWLGSSSPAAIMLGDVFFDFQPVYGDAALAESLRAFVTERVPADPLFLRLMFEHTERHAGGLRSFGRFLTDRHPGPHHGEIDLKAVGLLPLVEAVRLLALKQGVAETGTLARIDALAALGVLPDADAAALRQAFATLTALLLRHQLAEQEAGRPVGAHIPPAALSPAQAAALKEAFRAVASLRRRLRLLFTGIA